MPIDNKDHFPGYPNLRRVVHSDRYGRMELVEISETSDGFLLGQVLIGEGDEQYTHSVFLGTVAQFRADPNNPG